MKKAAIEIGSNSIRYMFGITNKDSVDIITEKRVVTRLRDSVETTQMIAKHNLDQSLKCINKFLKDAEEEGILSTRVIATDVLRKAANKDTVIAFLEKELDRKVHVLSPEQEAHFAFLGATQSTTADKNFLVCDIGGGSTEIVCSELGHITYAKSLNLGAIALTEKHFTEAPPTQADIDSLTNNIKAEIMHLQKPKKPFTLITVGGTATTLSCLLLQKKYISKEINRFSISINPLCELIKKLEKSNTRQIETLPGMEREKADIILAGTNILKNIMLYFNAETAYPKTTGVLYGCLLSDQSLYI